MSLKRIVSLAGLLALSAGPANAQDITAAGSWLDWGSRMVHETIDTLAYPFQEAWTKAWDVIGKTDADVAAEKLKFTNKLKTELAAFSKDVSRTGFELSTISISTDIVPKIALNLSTLESVDEATEAKLRMEFQDQQKYGTIERTILLGLLDLDETAAGLKVEGYKFSDVDIELVAIFPEVTLNFEREDASTPAQATAPAEPNATDGTTPALSN